jgi:hypothetical protein
MVIIPGAHIGYEKREEYPTTAFVW